MTNGIDVELEGPFFKADLGKTLAENAEEATKWLIRHGPPLVRGNLELKHPTGVTASLPEEVMIPVRRGGYFVAFGIVWPRPGVTRGGSRLYPAARVPYIVNAVLERGNYGGKRAPNRKAHRHWRRARETMRHLAARITYDMAKGLD